MKNVETDVGTETLELRKEREQRKNIEIQIQTDRVASYDSI